ncbi:Sister chromatid cohesion protein 2 [Phytophthora boehmeriae]|uniref:Sister chromatid cohesion protein 2 n=1 Tax=Phytophthora boehmeriae TaxID=109152 RepID=A0A8T1XCX1_9STRA|nr:Sister chromatid cohesion protein 2 [Phytophthora boehmeriae]
MFVFPLYVEPEEAAAADALEAVQPVASEPSPVSEAFNPQRLSTIIRSNSNGGLGDASEATADVLHTLPKWAQAVMQTGCFNVRTGQSQFTRKMKRASQQEEDASERPRKRRPMGRREADVTPIEDENSALQECLDELNATKDAEVEDEDVLPTLMTQAQRVAHSMEKYAELLEQLLEKATTCQQHEAFERDEMDVFSPADVKTLSQATKAMDKSDWIRKLDPNLLISVMNVFDTQVQLGLALDVQSALLPNDDDDKMQSPDRMASRLEMALDVAICELIVMATPQIDRKALSEENIDNCIQLLHHVIRRFLLLCIDTTFVTSASAVAKNNAGKRQSIGNKGRVNLRTNKIIRKAVERIIPVVCEFMNQLAALITVVKLADRKVVCLFYGAFFCSTKPIENYCLKRSWV